MVPPTLLQSDVYRTLLRITFIINYLSFEAVLYIIRTYVYYLFMNSFFFLKKNARYS